MKTRPRGDSTLSAMGNRALPARFAIGCLTIATALPLATPRPLSAAEPSDSQSSEAEHPLRKMVRYAAKRAEFIRENVRDYRCQLVKRERIDGRLQPYHFAITKVRCEQPGDDDQTEPMAVLMEFQSPSSVKGRVLLYVDGENNGDVLIRKGGRGALKQVELRIDPSGRTARRESNYPISEIGLARIMDRLIRQMESDIEHDPTAENTKVSYFRNAKVKDRVCTHIQVVHPERGEGLLFHHASLYVDDELQVPIRMVSYDWPEEEGEKPKLIEEYNYVNLELNVGLEDEEFLKSTHFDDL